MFAVLIALIWFSPFYLALTLGVVVTLGVWEWTQFAQIKTGFWRLLIAGLVGCFLFIWIFGEAHYLRVGRVLKITLLYCYFPHFCVEQQH